MTGIQWSWCVVPSAIAAAAPGTLPAPTAPTLDLTILRKALRSTTEEGEFENFSNYLWSFRTRMPFAARIYCDEQYFYWAARFAFGNKRGNYPPKSLFCMCKIATHFWYFWIQIVLEAHADFGRL